MNKNSMSHHEAFLQLAFEQALNGLGDCAPNPSVGAVAVLDGKVLAKSYHHGSGQAHAEVEVLSLLPQNLKNMTLYVTLEPCNHWGKTPPCVDAIIEYGISEVVFAYRDPYIHQVGNDTTEILNRHGIKVLHHPMPIIDAFYQSYSHWVKFQKPLVVAKWAQSFDGKVGYHDKRVLLTSKDANQFTHQQRKYSDVILTSSQTIVCDNPKLNVRLASKAQAKPVAVLDRKLQLTGKELFFSHASRVHIFHQANQQPKYHHPHVQFHEVNLDKHGMLDLKAVLSQLGNIGYHQVWLEAGPCLMKAFHQQQLVKKTHIILSPLILGHQALSAYSFDFNYFASPYVLQYQQLGDNMLTTLLWQDK
jgi:diaminohydroxyphosphoribosylaminopyrimidine deaminase/5-amino-6-(5-phosphoribosylamino)uracil reductase